MSDLPRPAWMSRKDREYLQRLMMRKGLLDIRLRGSQLRDTQEMKKERNALEWAIEKLSKEPRQDIEVVGIFRQASGMWVEIEDREWEKHPDARFLYRESSGDEGSRNGN